MHRNYYSSNFGNAAAANGPAFVGAGNSSRSSHSNSNSNNNNNNYHKYDHLVNAGNPNLNMRSIYENYLSSRHIDGHTNYTPAATTNLRYDDNDYPIPTSKIQYYAPPEPPVDYGYSGYSGSGGAKSLPTCNTTSSFSSNSSLNRYRNNRDLSDNNFLSSSCSSNNTTSVLPLPPSALSPTRDERETSTSRFLAAYDPSKYDPLTETENLLRLKWLDNSPRMSRLREHRQKRLMNKLEQFELWDAEQEQKQKQYELAREQRYKNIMDRLKNQEFCVNLMKKRHESDLETTRELEAYPIEHHYVDVLDDPKTNYRGPVSQYRKFQAEMDDKLRHLQHDIDLVNPRYRIEQAIIPRLERTRELYSVEPDTYTQRGKRVQKRPPPLNKNLVAKSAANGSYIDTSYHQNYQNHGNNNSRDRQTSSILSRGGANGSSASAKLKPIIHNSSSNQDDQNNKPRSPKGGSEQKKVVIFNDEVEYSSRKESVGGAGSSEEASTTNGSNNEPKQQSSSSSPPQSPTNKSSSSSATNDNKIESTTTTTSSE